ncbi:MAG: hypothetical protein CR997_01265 [Acidobacteria bacterium]|nr:MAG: hypothetical protein CR997_01265 [Acidobacteriota bacterium]
MRPVIALLTDYGTRDGFVGTLRGVIKRLSPFVDLVDITHQIPAQDILSASFVLAETAPYFPSETVFLAVVDPTVGTSRKAIIARNSWGLFVCPDNGLLSRVHLKSPLEHIVSIENPKYTLQTQSTTFHGRDIFAPVAAYLSRGESMDVFGPPLEEITLLESPKPIHHVDGSIEGRIIHIDVYGNLISNIPYMKAEEGAHAEWILGEKSFSGIKQTYADVDEGNFVAVKGSHGYCELSINKGNASHVLGVKRGDKVILSIKPDS